MGKFLSALGNFFTIKVQKFLFFQHQLRFRVRKCAIFFYLSCCIVVPICDRHTGNTVWQVLSFP